MISIITPWRDRTSLRETAPRLAAMARAAEGDLTIVNNGGDPDALIDLLGPAASSARIVSIRGCGEFNKPLTQNVGAHQATQPLLFFCDCDILMEAVALLELSAAVRQSEDAFGTVQCVEESDREALRRGFIRTFGYQLDIILENGRSLRIVDHEPETERGVRAAPGMLMVRRSHFLEVGGFNSALKGWGWEDQDIIARLTLGLGLTRVDAGRAIHLTHNDAVRAAAYDERDIWNSRDRSFRTALANYDAGNFFGTLRQDAQSANWEGTQV